MNEAIRVHAFQVVGWGKNILPKDRNASTICDGSYFLSRDRALEFANSERVDYSIREIDGVLLSEVMDPENYGKDMPKKSQKPTLVTEIEVDDPDTGEPVAVEIWKAPNGALFGIDATYLDQVRDTGIPSPFDDGVTFDMSQE